MADLLTGLNAKVSIGPVAADTVDDLAGFEALTPYVEVGFMESVDPGGDESADVSANVINEGRTRHAKGTRDGGTATVTCFWKPDDAGQIDMQDAQLTSNRYAIKVERRDRLTPGGTDSALYFRGLVRSAKPSVLTANDPQRIVFMIGVDSEQIYDPPT